MAEGKSPTVNALPWLAIALRAWAICIALLSGCTDSRAPVQEGAKPAASVGARGCMEMIGSFCASLASRGKAGNLLMSSDASEAGRAFFRAILQGRSALPADLRSALERHGYFKMVSSYLKSPGERFNSAASLFDIRKRWESALFEARTGRMSARFGSDYDPQAEPALRSQDQRTAIELEIEGNRIRNDILTETSWAIWASHPNWEIVRNDFEAIRSRFVAVIHRLALPETVRSEWLRRIRSVRLVLPGTLNDLSNDLIESGITNEECLTNGSNAYYSLYENALTVCAGDFNHEDALQSIAHELGHALDLDSMRYEFQSKSTLASRLAQLVSLTCGKAKFSCVDWAGFKRDFPALLRSLEGFRSGLPELHRCLQRRKPRKPLLERDIRRAADEEVERRFAKLAEDEILLRLTKPQVPLEDLKLRTNPSHLNPCAYFSDPLDRAPVDHEVASLAFFASEYQCAAGDPVKRLSRAVSTAKRMSRELLSEVIRTEGRFSPRESLENAGYSSSSSERFADLIGSFALADYLRALPTQKARREAFLASSPWLCEGTALELSFPSESDVLSSLLNEPHTQGAERTKELFTAPLREALGCARDFEFDECSLE